MKTKHRIFGMLLVAVAIIFMDACKGEKGDVGPAGTAGVAGPTGANGATGVAGPTGTANVQYSDWITVSFTGSGTSGTAYRGTITAPKITQDIMDKGVVLSYYFLSPNVYSVNAGVKDSYSLIQELALGKISYLSNFSYNGVKFRYVIIPGGVSIGGGRKASLESMTYEEVKALYNIPD
jgi:hypothetical protein